VSNHTLCLALNSMAEGLANLWNEVMSTVWQAPPPPPAPSAPKLFTMRLLRSNTSFSCGRSVGSGRNCSPRHRMPNSILKDTWVSAPHQKTPSLTGMTSWPRPTGCRCRAYGQTVRHWVHWYTTGTQSRHAGCICPAPWRSGPAPRARTSGTPSPPPPAAIRPTGAIHSSAFQHHVSDFSGIR
jgi:hypothetical protein